MIWFNSFVIAHLFTGFMNQPNQDEPDLLRSRQLESSEMRGSSETIRSSPALDLSNHTDDGIGFDIDKRTSGDSSPRETSNASSNGGSSKVGTSNGEASIGGKTGSFRRLFHMRKMRMLKPTLPRHRASKSPMVCMWWRWLWDIYSQAALIL